MKMYANLDALPDTPIEPVVTLGNFDGVHRGHQAILARLQQEAKRTGAPTMVITFDRHPRTVLRPDLPFSPLMSLRGRLRRLWQLDVDHCLVIPFDEDFAEMTASEFVEDILWDALQIRGIYVGPYATFGHRREGDFRFLQSSSRNFGFGVGEVDPIFVDGKRISSSRVRQAVAAGQMEVAARLLGRHHNVVGEVVHGDGRGQGLGFPTANLETDGGLVPPAGVYAAWAHIGEGPRLKAVVNIGTRPTFGDEGATRVEAHLLEGGADIYGQTLSLAMVKPLRGEAKFPNATVLKRQIAKDVEAAMAALVMPE